ncbi:MAG: prolyl oligopeptidase family serine peptidase [Acidobacteriota bacterium]
MRRQGVLMVVTSQARIALLGVAVVLATDGCSDTSATKVASSSRARPRLIEQPEPASSPAATPGTPIPALPQAPPFDAASAPMPGGPQTVVEGVSLRIAKFQRGGEPMTLWIYEPDPLPERKLPCVLVAPAGTPLVYGNELGKGDMVEHVPYAERGYAVVAYSLDGPVARGAPDSVFDVGARKFLAAELGVANARAAIDYIAAQLPEIDPARIAVAGHSSAATLALQVAENEPRVKAAIAYAPVVDLMSRFKPEDLEALAIPGLGDALKRMSPDAGISKLQCPTFLFHADDDTNVKSEELAGFVEKLKSLNTRAVYETVEEGEHYDSMIEQGIPKALAWLKSLPEINPPAARS